MCNCQPPYRTCDEHARESDQQRLTNIARLQSFGATNTTADGTRGYIPGRGPIKIGLDGKIYVKPPATW